MPSPFDAGEDSPKEVVSWIQVQLLCERIYNRVEAVTSQTGKHILAVLALGRGGATAGAILANFFDVRMFYIGLSSYKGQYSENICVHQGLCGSVSLELIKLGPQLLVVDDIYDTGQTFASAKRAFHRAKTAALLSKQNNAPIDFVGGRVPSHYWVVFPWEKSHA